MTLGERRVRASFNPSGDDIVASIKRHAAMLIDLVGSIEPADFDRPGEVARWKALAMTDAESASSWAVKAATAERKG